MPALKPATIGQKFLTDCGQNRPLTTKIIEFDEIDSVFLITPYSPMLLYTSKFGISVVDLTLIDRATDEDKKLHRHLWASFFRATTWEEINMIATQDKNIQLAATKLYQLSEDQRIRDELWARQDAIRQQIDFENFHKRRYEELEARTNKAEAKLAETEAKIIKAEAELAETEAKTIKAEAELAEKDKVIASLMAEIEQLKAGK